jgi:DNA-directed RNA polymerase subunit RPC12/RpoP
MKYYNSMAPFPVFDTSYVNDVENKLINIMSDKTKEYDEEPVVACRHCKSLHIVTDDIDNNVCMRCGSINEMVEFENIYKYKEYLKLKDE